MNGVHDMGGMHGFGPIEYEENEPVFHEAWEGRVYAMRTQTRISIPGGFRFAVERMGQSLYLASNYYERWLHSGVQGFIEAGAFSQEEFDERLSYFRENPEAIPKKSEDSEAVERAIKSLWSSRSHRREIDVKPSFAIGDTVRAKNIHPAGHTRLPQYARGKSAVIVNYYGVQDFDDAMSAGRGPDPQPLYNVRFEGQELWGESAEPNSAVYLDMWESYLEAA